MEKIKITKEQEEKLESYKRNFGIDHFITYRYNFHNFYKSLKNFTPEDFAKLLCGWYEVQQPFEVGDWIYDTEEDEYYKIVEEGDWVEDKRNTLLSTTNELIKQSKKVTDSWKIMLLNEGREKPEFKINDMYVDVDGEGWVIDDAVNTESVISDFEHKRVKIFFPVERGIELN